jgi:hypothetical protein
MRQRESWTFNTPMAELLAGTERRLTYHKSRAEFWLARFEEIKKQLPESLSIANIEAMANQKTTSNYGPPRLQFDPKTEHAFNLATQKFIEHRNAARVVERWYKIFKASTSLELACGEDDLQYFWVHDGDAEKFAQAEDEKDANL